MKVHDNVNDCDVEIQSIDDLVKIMQDGRQVDLICGEEKSDASRHRCSCENCQKARLFAI